MAYTADTMSWWGGQTYCQKHYTDLASATTAAENTQIQQVTAVQGISWFGLFRDTWMWSDQSIPMALQWTPGFPNNADHNDNCGSVNNSMFMDRPCNSLYNFFCHTRESESIKVSVSDSQKENFYCTVFSFSFVILTHFVSFTAYKVRYQVVKLQIQGDQSVFNPDVQSAILQQVS